MAPLLCVCAALTSLTASAEGGSLADIVKRGQLTVGTEAAYEPYEFVQDGEVTGYGRDVLLLISEKLGVKLNQLNLPFQGLLPGLMTRKFDLVATSVGINEERAKRFLFTRPIGIVNSTILVRSDNDAIKSPEDLNQAVLGTQLGSSTIPIVEAFNAKLKQNGQEGYRDLRLFTAYPDVASALENKSITAAIIPSNIAAVQMRSNPGMFKDIGSIGEPKVLAWVVHPQDKEILEFVNTTLDELAASGQLNALQIKWFGAPLNLPTDGYLPDGALQ
ncbi:amino acid ABC transporter substrate-binding protein [Lampropedia cohaerens]|uniref:Amino acid ABC transporter substrate-binding protein n=2 Tax=Lampropedia cohaerens TaxID=1610491 RepID=A0A0U1Q347_9BURK|nr:amino acid ABC transporter substrate-binding protein [Lampropedia cohaerens]